MFPPLGWKPSGGNTPHVVLTTVKNDRIKVQVGIIIYVKKCFIRSNPWFISYLHPWVQTWVNKQWETQSVPNWLVMNSESIDWILSKRNCNTFRTGSCFDRLGGYLTIPFKPSLRESARLQTAECQTLTFIEEGRRQRAEGRRFNIFGDSNPS